MMLLKCCTQYVSKFGKLRIGHRTGKCQCSFQTQRRAIQRMFKLLYNCTHFTCQQGHIQNSSSQASAVYEPRTSRCSNWIQKRQRNRRSNCQHLLHHQKSESSRKTTVSALLTMPNPLIVWITTNWKILKQMGIPDHLICLLRNLYAGQEVTVRTRHRMTDWFKIGKEVCQGCILSPCLFNVYAEYIM